MKKTVKLLVALLAILLILWWVDYQSVINSLKYINLKMLLVASIMQILTIYLILKQWKMIGNEMGLKLSMKELLHVNMAGTFVESVTPSVKLGGEATKVYLLRRKCNISMGEATAMVGLQKTISLSAFVVINFVAILWFFIIIGSYGVYGKLLLGSFFFLVLFLSTLILLLRYPHRLKGLISCFLSKEKQEKFAFLLENFRGSIRSTIRNKGLKSFGKHFIFALLIWILFPIKVYIISRGLNLELGFGVISIVTYLTYMVAMVPLLPGGLGTFEGSMIFLLTPFHIPLHEGMAFALMVRFVTFWFVFLLSSLYLGGYYCINLLCALVGNKHISKGIKE